MHLPGYACCHENMTQGVNAALLPIDETACELPSIGLRPSG
jgi:hypothetical protein